VHQLLGLTSGSSCLSQWPEGGAEGAAPDGSRAGVEALVHQLSCLRSGSSCLCPRPEGGAEDAPPVGSRAGVKALVHQLSCLRSGSSCLCVWLRVAPEAGPGPVCVQFSVFTTMESRDKDATTSMR